MTSLPDWLCQISSRTKLFILFLSFAAALSMFAGCSKKEPEIAPEVSVQVTPAKTGDVSRIVTAEAETALNELTGLARSAELAAESQRLTSLRYKDGEATVLEVVDSQTAYVQASNNYHDGAVRYRVALANLQTLTGVLTTP